MTAAPRLCLLLLASLLAVGSARSALAAPGEDNRTRARRLVEEAERSYATGAYAEALLRFGEAYEVWGDANLLFNVAQCNRQLGRDAPALKAYRDFVRAAPENSPLLPEARRRIVEIEARVEQARLAQVNEAARASQVQAASVPTSSSGARRGHALRWAGIGVGLAGLGLLGGGIAPALLADGARRDMEDAAKMNAVFDPSLEDRRTGLVLTAGVVFGVGGALLVTAVSLLGVGLSREARARR